MRELCTALLLLIAISGSAQDLPDNRSVAFLDFWKGSWEATWTETASTQGIGTNRIYDFLDGTAVMEEFEIHQGLSKGFLGRSMSQLDKQSGIWKQTWVDNQNSYLEFNSMMVDGTPCFHRSFLQGDSLEVQQRMVFRDIHPDHFTWDWESSLDGGESWKLVWQIHYQREEEH